MAKLQNMRGLQVGCKFCNPGASRVCLLLAFQILIFFLLQVFISDIRACSNRESEKTRVDKELGKIRKKFASNSSLTADFPELLVEYDKKKYVWKLLYIFMLGYDVEFGHKQAADLISASK
ncbi:hypothetical protein MMC29_000380 [Sticta canariensis]|nr:hypothetical protein [Sticta canariensis]